MDKSVALISKFDLTLSTVYIQNFRFKSNAFSATIFRCTQLYVNNIVKLCSKELGGNQPMRIYLRVIYPIIHSFKNYNVINV